MSAQYSTPVIGLIFLRFVDVRFAKVRAELEKIATLSQQTANLRGTRDLLLPRLLSGNVTLVRTTS
jgi:hypothetical protein